MTGELDPSRVLGPLPCPWNAPSAHHCSGWSHFQSLSLERALRSEIMWLVHTEPLYTILRHGGQVGRKQRSTPSACSAKTSLLGKFPRLLNQPLTSLEWLPLSLLALLVLRSALDFTWEAARDFPPTALRKSLCWLRPEECAPRPSHFRLAPAGFLPVYIFK